MTSRANMVELSTALARGSSLLSPESFQAMLSALPVAVYTTDADGRLTYYNSACVSLIGRIPVLGHDLWPFVSRLYRPDGTPIQLDGPALTSTLRQAEAFQGEFVAERLDGTRFWFRPCSSAAFDAEGRLLCTVNALIDITATKQAEAAKSAALRRIEGCLAGQKEAFQRAMSGQPLSASLEPLVRTAVRYTEGDSRAAFFIVGEDGKGLRHVTGMGEAYAQDVDGFAIGPDSFACGLAIYSGEPFITRDIDAEPLWDDWRWMARKHGFRGCWSFPVRTEGGPIQGTLARYFPEPREPTQDDLELTAVLTHAASIIISRHTEAQERVLAQNALSAALTASSALHEVSTELFGAMGDSERQVYDRIMDAAISIMRCDFASVQMLVESRGEPDELDLLAFRGFTAQAAHHWRRVRPDSPSSCGVALTTGQRVILSDIEACERLSGSADLAAMRQTGIRAVQSTPLVSRNGRFLGVISTHWRKTHMPGDRDLRLFDILARQTADLIERAQVMRALQDADKRKDEFLATLAHELRNPLAPIRYSVQVARAATRSEEQRENAVAVIDRQAAHMARLLDDLLDISRVTRGSLELRKAPVDLVAAISAAIEAARPLLDSKRHVLTAELPTHPVLLEADGVRITQIFSNLLTNAAKYTDPGGQILLSVREQEGEVAISVRDNGIGISPEDIPGLFSIFAQAKPALERAEGGLGIGLALVRGLVELHGGTIEASSAGEQRGSEFVVRLPYVPVAAGQPDPLPAKITPACAPLRVLVADDNHDGAEACAILLRLQGHDVRIADSGRQALELVQSFQPQLALLDIGMPVLNGYEAAREIRLSEWGRNMTLVAITGWGQESDREQALRAGFNRHLTKPIDAETLQALTALPEVANAPS